MDFFVLSLTFCCLLLLFKQVNINESVQIAHQGSLPTVEHILVHFLDHLMLKWVNIRQQQKVDRMTTYPLWKLLIRHIYFIFKINLNNNQELIVLLWLANFVADFAVSSLTMTAPLKSATFNICSYTDW